MDLTEPGIGRLGLWLAVLAGLASFAVGWRGRRESRWLLAVAAGSGALATVVLARALLDNDFSWTYVADNSRRHATAPYRLAALWGGMAGSLLLFATFLAVAGSLAAWRARRFGERTAATVAGLVGGVVAALAGLVVAFADPFERLDLPSIEGRGLTPILEHPAMLYHPPLLYAGLVSLAAPAALTLAVPRAGVAASDWVAAIRRWLVVPWTLLAVGMVAGAHWAYVELGWGGYWAWDPVENTALLPWLAVTLALHAFLPGTRARSVDGSRAFRAGSIDASVGRWRHAAAALVCLAFVLALGGTMLTRSGAVPSVHAFGEDRAVGRGLAVLLGVVTAGAALVLLRGRTAFAGGHPSPTPAPAAVGAAVNQADPSVLDTRPPPRQGVPARRTWLVRLVTGHLVVVGGVLLIATIGTAAPLVRELTGGDDVAIEGRYFAAFAGPLAVAGLALLTLVPVVTTRRSGTGAVYPAAVGAGGVGAVALLAVAGGELDAASLGLAAAAGCALGAAAFGIGRSVGGMWRPGTTSRPQNDGSGRRVGVGPHVAHAGLALLLLGVAGTVSGETTTVPLRSGESIRVGGEVVRYEGVTATEDGNGRPAVTATVEVDGRVLHPSLVAHEERGELLAETSLVSGPLRDIQVGLRRASVEDGQSNADAVATLQIGVHPLQVLVWWGALVLVAAGLALLLPRRGRRQSVDL